MKYLVLAFAVLLAACEPIDEPVDSNKAGVVKNPRQGNFKYEIIKLNDGRQIECIINDEYQRYAMHCNWYYKGNYNETSH
nr:MAG TPA: vitamin B12-binding protein [Caudoviricetes sp.]